MLRIISALLFCFSTWALAQDAKPLELAPNAPDRHIVVPGDTLWGISALFLKDPFRWPEIWRLNADDIKNPQRIYPGQVVILDRSTEPPRLKLGTLVHAGPRIYVSDEQKEIPSIPQHVIEPFLSRPLIVEPGALDQAARIVAIRGDHIAAGVGDIVYATRADAQTSQWQIFRPGTPLIDPDRVGRDGHAEVLGIEAMDVGSAHMLAAGEPATLEITASKQEISANDYLLPAPRSDIINYLPRAPSTPVVGCVIKIYGGVAEGGRLSIVSLSRGRRDGLERGHVLALYRAGMQVSNVMDGKKETYRLPEERYGLVFVFRVFDRVSYGLVMEAARSVFEGDTVRNP